mmetsp:Transcript_5736/g.21793  ORF Transcript_5736/g.21793 Transcript_5736/m.21793 type:complete len:259 (+) Transcript_5736:845-1621(+)
MDIAGMAKALPRSLPLGLSRFHLEAKGAWFQTGGLATLAALPRGLLILDLRLSGCRGVGSVVEALASGLPRKLKHLHLDFSWSDIRDRDVCQIASHLAPASALWYLHLSLAHCADLPSCIPVLGFQLPRELLDLHLNFAYTRVARTGFAALAGSLPPALRHFSLNLAGNYISGLGLGDSGLVLPAALKYFGIDINDAMIEPSFLNFLLMSKQGGNGICSFQVRMDKFHVGQDTWGVVLRKATTWPSILKPVFEFAAVA